VLAAWDALFARAPTTRAGAPKLDFLLDVCAAMLLRARGPISRCVLSCIGRVLVAAG
jgi:hypothetical protein